MFSVLTRIAAVLIIYFHTLGVYFFSLILLVFFWHFCKHAAFFKIQIIDLGTVLKISFNIIIQFTVVHYKAVLVQPSEMSRRSME